MAILFSEDLEDKSGTYSHPDNRLVHSINGNLGTNVFLNVTQSHKYSGSNCCECRVVGDGTTSVYRSELSGNGPGTTSANNGLTRGFVAGDEVYVGFSILCDDTLLSNISDIGLFWQMHITQDSGGIVNPPLSLMVKGNDVYFVHRYSTVANADNVSVFPIKVASVPLGKMRVGQWTRFEIRMLLQHSIPGITELKRDGTLLYSNSTSPNWYNNTTRVGYLKFGIYNPSWTSVPPAAGTKYATRKWFVDDIIVGTSWSDLQVDGTLQTPKRKSPTGSIIT